MICYWFSEPIYFFFASDLPELLYYSHIPTAIIALLVGILVLWHAPKQLLNRLLFVVSLSFSLWTFVNLILWTNIHSDFLLFSWSFLRILSSVMSVFCIYFVYVFLTGKDVSSLIKGVFLLMLAPVFILAPTDLNVGGFDITNCDAFRYEGVLFQFYHIAFGVLAFFWILFLLIRHYRKADAEFRKQIVLIGVGIESFLFLFFAVIFLAVRLTEWGILPDSRLEMYGLFGMTFFMAMVAIMIARFNAFSVSASTSLILIFSLLLLTVSQFAYVESRTGNIITAVTLAVTIVISFLLVRSVRKEVKQRKQLQVLTTNLEKANARLKVLDKQKSEFLSIATHQLRTPLTSMRGYASMLLEGSYGEVSTEFKQPLSRIHQSSRMMATVIEDYLNVSRIEAGNMKYTLTDFNLPQQVSQLCDDLRPIALKEGLALIYRSDLHSTGIINADVGKTAQIIQNLINNAIKYTKEGSIRVLVRDDIERQKLIVDIIDTGIGMSRETLATIFHKFERASNASAVNVHGTGLGLYVALKMAEAMGGTITAHSEGEGNGSRFTLEFPLAL